MLKGLLAAIIVFISSLFAATPSAGPTPWPSPTPFTASFEIYTLGTRRIFTDSMYHNLSPDAYIQNPNPSLIQIAKPGFTWAEFFATLPFSLDSKCLVTGTGQKFCTNSTHQLTFTLDGRDTPQVLSQPIGANQKLVVSYSPR